MTSKVVSFSIAAAEERFYKASRGDVATVAKGRKEQRKVKLGDLYRIGFKIDGSIWVVKHN